MTAIIKKNDMSYFVWLTVNIFIYMYFSYILNRSMFSGENDGFFYQIISVSNGDDLGVLSFMHSIRFAIAYFFFTLDNIVIHHLLLLIYLSPMLFFIKLPNQIKYFTVSILYLSLFFSYRTLLVMESLFILIAHIRYERVDKKYLLISFLFSLLSSGTLLLWISIVLYFKKCFIKSSRNLKYINLFLIMIFPILMFSIAQKILFFIDQEQFSGSTSVTVDAFSQLSFSSFITLFMNIFERSILYESWIEHMYGRLVLLFIEVNIAFFLVINSKNKLYFFMFILSIFSTLFEGLMVYSLFFVFITLFYEYLYRQLIRS